MFKKTKNKILATVVSCGAILTTQVTLALAENPIAPVKAEDVSSQIVNALNDILMPIGGVVIFVTIIIAAFKIITTANRPTERAEAMTSLPYIVGGGLLLGGALMAAGLIYGLMEKMHTASVIISTFIA